MARQTGVWGGRLPLLLFLAAAGAGRASEQAFGTVWQAQAADPADPGAVLRECDALAKATPDDSFAAVAQTLGAWHLLNAGRVPEARAALVSRLAEASDPIREGARELARAWLTLLDLEAVRESLRAYYRLEVRYPDSLAALAAHPRLPAAQRPPLTDRWGQAWNYQLAEFTQIRGLGGQRYRIESPKVPGVPGLAEALAIPYGSRMSVEPVRLLKGAGGAAAVQFRRTGAAAADAGLVLQVGAAADGLFLAHVGASWILVCDGLHWRAWPVPNAQ